MAIIYSDYSRARIGWFFGHSGWQLAVVALSTMPVFWSIQTGAWISAALFLMLWVTIVLVTVTPVRGRSTFGWVAASLAFATGGLAGWTRFRSKAARGQADSLEEADLPGVLHAVEVHDGPPQGPRSPGWRSSRTTPPEPGRSRPQSSTPGSGYARSRSGSAKAVASVSCWTWPPRPS